MSAQAEVQKIPMDWIIIMYDLPTGGTEEDEKRNNAFRAYFIYNARKLGAMMRTESVYMMPFTPAGIKLAREITTRGGGQVYIFASKITEPKEAKRLTLRYNSFLENYFDELEQRIKEAEEAVTSGTDNRAVFQKIRAADYFIQVCDQVIARRGDKTLETRFRAFQTYIPKIRESYEKRKAAQQLAKAQEKAAKQ